MKKLLLLLFIISVTALSSFGQEVMNSDYLTRKYILYTENTTPCQITTLSYKQWKNKYNYIEESGNIQLQSDAKRIKSSGNYLIRAQKQKTVGYIFAFAGVGVICASPNKIGIVGISACSLIALVYEVLSINNMNKAKVCLTQKDNGVGLTVKF